MRHLIAVENVEIDLVEMAMIHAEQDSEDANRELAEQGDDEEQGYEWGWNYEQFDDDGQPDEYTEWQDFYGGDE